MHNLAQMQTLPFTYLYYHGYGPSTKYLLVKHNVYGLIGMPEQQGSWTQEQGWNVGPRTQHGRYRMQEPTWRTQEEEQWIGPWSEDRGLKTEQGKEIEDMIKNFIDIAI